MASKILEEVGPQRVTSAIWRSVPVQNTRPGQMAPPRPSPAPSPERTMAEQAEAQRRLAEAHQKGYAEGLAAARAQSEAQVSEVLGRLSASAAELSRLPQKIRDEATPDLVSLAIATAARILHRELTVDPEAIAGLVRAAFDKLQTRDIHRVKMHPIHEAAVRRMIQQIQPGRTVELVADPTMQPGDLTFETQQGQLDASVTTQLREIERGLADRLRN